MPEQGTTQSGTGEWAIDKQPHKTMMLSEDDVPKLLNLKGQMKALKNQLLTVVQEIDNILNNN